MLHEQDAPERTDSGGKPCVLRMVGLAVPRAAAHHSFLYLLRRHVAGQYRRQEEAQVDKRGDDSAQHWHPVFLQIFQFLRAVVC